MYSQEPVAHSQSLLPTKNNKQKESLQLSVGDRAQKWWKGRQEAARTDPSFVDPMLLPPKEMRVDFLVSDSILTLTGLKINRCALAGLLSG